MVTVFSLHDFMDVVNLWCHISKLLDARFSPYNPDLTPGIDHVGFVMEKVAS
jgi:hypothetical protein